MIKSLLGLADIINEPQQVHRWLYQLRPFAEGAEGDEISQGGVMMPEMDDWDSQSVHQSESESLQSPGFPEKTNQDKLRQWLDITERLHLELAKSTHDVFEGVGALFAEVEDH